MADPKNEMGKTSSNDKQTTGSEPGAGGKVSAGTSVGNIGQAPMPHSQSPTKPAQSSTLASHTSKPMGGGEDKSRSGASQSQSSQPQSSQPRPSQPHQGESIADKAQQTAEQVREKAAETFEDTAEWAQDTYERVSDWASDTYEQQRRRMGNMRDQSGQRFGQVRGGVQSYVAENPMVVGLVGLAAGLLLGALIPRTRRENEFFGEWSDEVRNQGLRYARDAASRGREYVEEAFSGDDAQFSRHESEFRPDRPDANRH